MEHKNLFYTSDRLKWRQWLIENFEKENEIWLVFPTIASGEPSISYNDAVEEALCFGWIDSTLHSVDETHKARRFTPRREGSTYSRPNIERLIWLDERGMIHPSVRESVADIIKAPYEFPKDILEEIRKNEIAWLNYEKLSEPYKRIRVAYIDAARKRPKEFEKRLRSFISKTMDNKLIMGYGGIDKYYR